MNELKIIYQDKRKGLIKLKPETLTDLYTLYHIILPGDKVKAWTKRRIRKISAGEGGNGEKRPRKPMFLGIDVVAVNFHEFTGKLRIRGTIFEGPEDYVSFGSYHTLNIQPGNTLKIIKEKGWPSYAIKRLKKAVKIGEKPPIAILAIEEGESILALVTDFGIKEIGHITMNVPRKSGDIKQHEAAIIEFLKIVTSMVKENINPKIVSTLIIGGPGFTKEHFLKYLKEKAPEIAKKTVTETATSGTPQAINEIIKRGTLEKIAEGLEIARQTELMNEFLKRLGKDEKNIAYGQEEIEKAAIYGAIENLLLTEDGLRTTDQEKRQFLENLLENTEKSGGHVEIVNINSEIGKQIKALGGMIALLRFPI